MIIDELENNTILVVRNDVKLKLIAKIRKIGLLNIKFMSLKELKDKYYFSYNEEAIYYLINKYGYKYEVAVKYLDNLCYVNFSEYDNAKLEKLRLLKQELEDNNLLIYNKLFKESIKNYKIIVYNYGILSKEDNILLDSLKKDTSVLVINDEKKEYRHDYIYEFADILGEVSFVASKIAKLIKQGVDVNRIKVCGINDEYKNQVKRIFALFKIPIVFNEQRLYATAIAQDFLAKLDSNLDNTLNYLKNKYKLDKLGVKEIYDSLLGIVNKYCFIDDITKARSMLIHDFSKQKINIKNLKKEVEVISTLEGIDDDDYVFLMSFNQGIIPKNYKDEDYLSDKIKKELQLDTTSDLNSRETKCWLSDIKKCKNLVITYKKSSPSGDFYLSSLNDYLGLKVINVSLEYTDSNLYNKLVLARDIDELVKYNTKTSDIGILFKKYKDINYMSYDNRFTGIDKDNLKKFIKNRLYLSYSSINNYYQCSFKYYLSNVLRVNIFEENFYTVLGNIFHYILSICFKEDIDLREEYYKAIERENYQFSVRDRFFLDNLLEELEDIIKIIKKQNEYSSLSDAMYEHEVKVDKSREDMLIIFKGYIDKILLDQDKTMAAIIDYKTGNPKTSLNNAIYGLDLQLPVYSYLIKNEYPHIRIVGFYLQRILNNSIVRDNKHSYEYLKEDRMKLQGYTNNSIELISKFDSGYNESKVIRGMRTTSKGLGSKKVLTDREFDKLYEITDNKIEEAIDNILEANFNVNPKRIGGEMIGCKNCKYRDICFMTERDIIDRNEYKKLEFLQDENEVS